MIKDGEARVQVKDIGMAAILQIEVWATFEGHKKPRYFVKINGETKECLHLIQIKDEITRALKVLENGKE